MAKKLSFFNVGGNVEYIRYLLHYSGDNFEDLRHEHRCWPIKSIESKLPFEQLPQYVEGNRSLCSALAIARFLAKRLNLIPTEPWDEAVVDSIAYNAYEFWIKAAACYKEKDPIRAEAMIQRLLSENIHYFYSRFEKDIKANKGYLFNGQLTWADFVLVGLTEGTNQLCNIHIERNYPTVAALMQKIKNLPGVKEYVANREFPDDAYVM